MTQTINAIKSVGWFGQAWMRIMSNRHGPFRALLDALLVRLVRPLQPGTSRVVYMAVLAVVLILAAHQLWRRHAGQVLADRQYVLTADRIELTHVPPWIRADLPARAVRDGSLAGLNLTQPNLTVRVADAFAMQPWVSRVNRVKKKYGRVVVDLDYRRPVAMVWVTDPKGQPGLFPVDSEGRLLPPGDFDREQVTKDYLQVEVRGAEPWPADQAGSTWGDDRIHGAARLATVLLDCWKSLGLSRIVVIDRYRSDGSKAPPAYQLLARSGAVVAWGSAPGEEASGEPSPSQKIARLRKEVKQQGQLPPGQTIELQRPATGPSLARRPRP